MEKKDLLAEALDMTWLIARFPGGVPPTKEIGIRFSKVCFRESSILLCHLWIVDCHYKYHNKRMSESWNHQ